MNSGVYKITIGDYYYFGSTGSFAQRKSAHLSDLRKQSHRNIFLQRNWNKGHEFNFSVLERADVSSMIALEQSLIDAHIGDRYCMNLSKNAACAFACPENKEKTARRNREMVWTAEMRKKLSDSRRGRKATEEEKAGCRMRAAGTRNPNATLTENDIADVLRARQSGETIKSLAQRFNVNRTTITRTCAKFKVFYKPSAWSPTMRVAQMLARANSKSTYKRNVTGEKNPRSILTLTSVCEIRLELQNGARMADLARKHGVHPATIRSVKTGQNWKRSMLP
jgi:group I intron endonuclease